MNSLQKLRLNTPVRSIKASIADEFLEELLNLDVTNVLDLARFIRRFRHLLPAPGPNRAIQGSLENGVLNWQRSLRAAWHQATPFGREITLLPTIAAHLSSPEDQAHPDAYASVLLRALHIVDRLRVCKRKKCLTPYFIWSPKRRGYCSDICAREAQSEFKRDWWDKYGLDWQRKRRAKKQQGKTKARKSQLKPRGGKRK